MIIIKRDGREVKFDECKMVNSVEQAARSANQELTDESKNNILKTVEAKLNETGKNNISVEKLQDVIQTAIYIEGLRSTKDAYMKYRKNRTDIREKKSDIMKTIQAIGVHTDKDNGNKQ